MKQMYTANLANELDRELADKLFLRNELVAKMKELGFGDAYVELHERLLDLGFAVDSGVKENLVKNGRITYRYDTPYVVKCSRESGYLAISATLKGDGLYLYTGNDDLEEICYYEEYSSKAKAYIDLNSEYITEADGYGIEFSGQGYFGVLINENTINAKVINIVEYGKYALYPIQSNINPIDIGVILCAIWLAV